MTKNGFTLIEILVYISVLTIVILAVSSFFLWAIRSNNKAKAIRETHYSVRRAMDIISYEIREANSVYTPTTNSNQLSLETTKYLPVDETSTFIDFFLCGTQVCFKKESQSPFALTSDRVEVNSLNFIQVASTSVQIGIGINFENPENRSELQVFINATSTASIRAY